MDRIETVIDIESCVETSQEVETPSLSDDTFENIVSITICGVPMSVDENSAALSNNNSKNADDKANNNKEKCKSKAAKKPFSKPPRPPKGLVLDASDQKLIKEISDLAMIKRARIERMKALKKMKAAKASSTSSSGNLIAMVFTVIFCVVVIFQGCHSSVISHGNKLESKGVAVGNIIAVQGQPSFSAGGVPLTSVEFHKLVKLDSGSDSKDGDKKAIH
ncbi:hypothetical protein CASFOL_030170 [Castilleja foliolosa]|uniref:Uncharacterized protein n=1 Tax=Castilleja foliolosa TaxID=1961234 RepID=A0ABD3CC16_9LAMI